MTEKQLRQLVVSTFEKYIGCKESDGSHKKIIDMYNSQKPLPVGYKVSYYDAWCAAAVSAVAVELGLTDIIFPECGCGRMRDLYITKGGWVENDAYVPQAADLIMYDWDDDGVGDNKGGIEHVGMVTKVSGNTIYVLEGNKNDSVDDRTIKVDGRYIRGFCCPDYAKKAASYKAPSSATSSTSTTSTSVYTIEKFVRDVQSATGAKVDGIPGSETISKTVTLSATVNRKHAAVKAVQKRLDALGYKEVGKADGIAGPKFTAAVKAFQKANGCVVDGVITANNKTWKKLLGMI